MDSDCITLDSPDIPPCAKAKQPSTSNARRSLSQPLMSMQSRHASLDLLTDSDDDESISTQAAALVSPRKKRTKKVPAILDEFFGVYCLISRSPLKHYKNRCYIGYTIDPNRRIVQHNGGKEKGGAKKTDNRGPWDMVCIVHGFPNSIAALRFEWAWQNPETSKAIKHLTLKKARKETPFAYRLRVACHLMNSAPWNRFALTFRWLLVSEKIPFPSDVPPPSHVAMEHGLVKKTSTIIPQAATDYTAVGRCGACQKPIEKLPHLIRCLNSTCSRHFHARCFAEEALKKCSSTQLFPMKASCPRCRREFYWGDLVREQRMILKIDEAKTGVTEAFKGLVPKVVVN